MESLPPYFEQYDRLLARREPFVSLVDMRPCRTMPGADVRKAIADWGLRIADERERWVVGVAFVVTHPLVRAALAVVHWQAPPRQPTRVCSDPQEALDFLVERLSLNGLPRPDGLAALRSELATGEVAHSGEFGADARRKAR